MRLTWVAGALISMSMFGCSTEMTGTSEKFAADPCPDCGSGMSPENFTEQILETIPGTIQMPPEIVDAMRWLEAQNALSDSGNEFSLSLYPNHTQRNFENVLTSAAEFFPFDPRDDIDDYDPEPGQFRLVRFMLLGDGSIGIWIDDAGRTQFVMMDSWGSEAIGIITDDPVALLSFLAIGYGRPGAYRGEAMTPEEIRIAYDGGPEEKAQRIKDGRWEPILPPTEFATYIERRYGKPIPKDGSGLVRLREGRSDAFTRWYASVARRGN